MDVFISSLITGYEEHRAAAAEAIETLGHRIVRAEDFAATSSTPQQACLAGVRASDVVVLLVVDRYGAVQESGLSATHEEYLEARETKPVLVFVQSGVDRDDRQQQFLDEVQAWTTGHFRAGFDSVDGLRSAVTRALHELELARSTGPVDEEEMVARARDMLGIGRSGRGEARLVLAVACGPYQQVIRPADIEATELSRALQQEAMFGSHAVLDPESATSVVVRGSALHLEQERGAVLVDESGALRIVQPARPVDGRTGAVIPALIEEEIVDGLRRALRFAGWTLARVDPVERLTDVVPIVALADAGYMPWRTRAEQQASPGTATMGMGDNAEEPVMLTPSRRHRQALIHDADRIAEDLMALLRRSRR